MKNKLADLETRIRLVRQIARDFRKPNNPNLVSWKAAFAAHPEWVPMLGADTKLGHSRFKSFATSILAGKSYQDINLEPPLSAAGASAVPLASAAPEELPKYAPDDPAWVALTQSLAAKYPTQDGGISWRWAFKAEPDLRDKLDAKSTTGMHRLRQRVRSTLLKSHRGKGKTARVGATPAFQEAPCVRCCPECGFLLELINKAYAATRRLQPSSTPQ